MNNRRYLDLDNDNVTNKNCGMYLKKIIRANFIALNAYIRKKGRLKFNELSIQFKKLEKEQQNKAKVEERKN